MRFPVRLGTCVLLYSLPLAAQLANHSITVTATPASTTPPDEVVFSVVVSSGLDQTLDDIVKAVSSLGLTAANLVNLYGFGTVVCQTGPPLQCPPPSQQWTFELVSPFSKMQATTAALASLQKTIGGAFSLTWSITGTQLSSQLANCNLANLAAQARAQVQQIAAAASITPGAIVSLISSNTVCLLTASFALGTPSTTSSITIATTDPLPTAPDQAIVTIYVMSGASASLSGIGNALTAAGITGATLTGIEQQFSYNDPVPGTQPMGLIWTFTDIIPLTQLKATLAQLTSAGQTISQGNSGLSLTFGASGLSFSQPPACSETALLAEAKTQAQNVAGAAGVNTGPVLSVSTPGSGFVAVGGQLGSFISGISTVPLPPFPPSVPLQTPVCSLTTQFQLF
jgi:hypothetical protein